jgi:hypothetical protein
MEFQFHLWPQDRYSAVDEIAKVVQAGERFDYTAAASGEHIIVPNRNSAGDLIEWLQPLGEEVISEAGVM